MKKALRPNIKGRQWLHKRAYSIGVIFSLLAGIAYIYGLVADPIQLWGIVHEAYLLR